MHEGGILNPKDGEFHGAVLRAQRWSFSTCQSCHGDDFAGGKSGVSCLSCHSAGPTSCATCHGQPPPSGGHVAHVNGTQLGHKLDCAECHQKPARWDDPGHLFAADGNVKSTAGVELGPLAGTGATWDRESASCSSVYCHGAGFTDSKATNTHPVWAAGQSQASCGTCHGLPPASHASTASCDTCHGAVTDHANRLLTPALHVTGSVHLGDGSGTCAACHGSADSIAPATGAHQAHLKAPHGLSAPIACASCHLVPAQVGDPGPLGHAGPAAVTFSGLAVADHAAPAFSHATLSCSATACHGGGESLQKDATPGLQRTVSWTATGAAACGACHGIPPQDGVHWSALRLEDCNKCHAGTIDARGTIIPGGAHLNGVVDVRAP